MTSLTHTPVGLAVILLVTAASTSLAQQVMEPFTPSARWSHYLRRTYGPMRLGSLAVDTAVDQMLRDPGCWDSSAASYGRRYERAFQRRVVRNTAELGAGLLTGEDLRYRVSQSHSIPARAWNALRSSVTAQMPDGSKRPAYTRFFATEVANASTAYLTRRSVQPAWMAKSLVWSTLDQAQVNLLDEFGPDLRRVGMRLWKRVRPGQ